MPTWLTEGLVEGNVDVEYVESLLDEFSTMFCVDAGRVYATGHSMGGGFASTLACTNSDRIAAIGPVSVWSVKDLGECAPERSVPIMGCFSIDDSGYEGGEWAPNAELWSFNEFGELWSGINNCAAGPNADEEPGGASSQAWAGSAAPTVMWTLSDGGHTWPGSSELFASTDVDASKMLWEFFSQHQRS